jgi:hypothetical protein
MSTVSGLIIDAFEEQRDQLDSVKENMESVSSVALAKNTLTHFHIAVIYTSQRGTI